MKEHLKVIEDGEGKDYDKLNDEAFNFMMQIDENDDRKLDVFKDEDDGKWHVDMRQFKGSKGLKVVSKRYCELDHFV